jgi:hypothetical protein
MDHDIDILLRAARAAPSADNSQPWCFVPGERMFSVAFDTERAGDGFLGPTSPATLIAIGALQENIRATARALDIDVHIENLLGSPPIGFPYLKVHLKQAPRQEIRENPLVFTRHTNRFRFHSRAIDSATLQSIASMQETPARLRVISDPDQRRHVAGLMSTASELRFQIKNVHLWLIDSLRFTEKAIATGAGLDVNTLLLPPGGKAFLRFASDWKRMQLFNRLGGYKLLAREEAKLVGKAPALVAVIAPSNAAGLFASGQLMERAWTALNAKKVAVHPYFAISDQLNRLQQGETPSTLIAKAKALQQECQQVFGYPEGESMHMLLRVGYPKADPRRSRRLPWEALIKEPQAADKTKAAP